MHIERWSAYSYWEVGGQHIHCVSLYCWFMTGHFEAPLSSSVSGTTQIWATSQCTQIVSKYAGWVECIIADNVMYQLASISQVFTDPPATLPCTLSTPPTLVSVCTHESLSNLSCAVNLHNCLGLSRPWWRQDIKLTVLCHQALSSTLCRQNIVNCQTVCREYLRSRQVH